MFLGYEPSVLPLHYPAILIFNDYIIYNYFYLSTTKNNRLHPFRLNRGISPDPFIIQCSNIATMAAGKVIITWLRAGGSPWVLSSARS